MRDSHHAKIHQISCQFSPYKRMLPVIEKYIYVYFPVLTAILSNTTYADTPNLSTDIKFISESISNERPLKIQLLPDSETRSAIDYNRIKAIGCKFTSNPGKQSILKNISNAISSRFLNGRSLDAPANDFRLLIEFENFNIIFAHPIISGIIHGRISGSNIDFRGSTIAEYQNSSHRKTSLWMTQMPRILLMIDGIFSNKDAFKSKL